ncbi:MAG: helix-turn-helix domain-containing protein [Myxococcota bacterium]
MTARRKKTAKKKAARKQAAKKKVAKKKVARTKKVARKKPGARKKKSSPRPRPGSGASRPGAAAREPARSWTAAVTERVTELVEHAAAGALRRALDAGGREIGAWLPESAETRIEAGAYLRELRELAGLTVDELSEAVELRDHSILAAVEAGTTTLSFELILRLAAILARHDPAPFVARLVRLYNPVLWQMLDDWGVGRLPLQGVREREFVNILRASDAARALSDEDFDRVLGFTREAFETALHFALESGAGRSRSASS